jgi:hypothetical protein
MLSLRKVWLAALALTAVALAATPARAVEPPKWVPADADALVVFNVKQTLSSALVKNFALKELQDALKQDDNVAQILKAAEIDPLKDIDSILMTVSDLGSTGKNELFVAVSGKFNAEKLHAAAENFAKKNPKELEFAGEGKDRVYKVITKDQTAFAAVPDGNTILVAKSKEFLQNAVKKGNAAKLNKDLAGALEKVKGGKESLWVVVVATDEIRKGVAGIDSAKDIAPKLDSLTGGFDVAEDLNLSILIHTSDAAAAKKVATELNKLKPFLLLAGVQNEQAKPYIDLIVENLKITNKDKDADIHMKLTAEQLKKAATPDDK